MRKRLALKMLLGHYYLLGSANVALILRRLKKAQSKYSGNMIMPASTAVHSNAFNFQSYVQHGVDPRTGQYTVSLSVPELNSNALAGPPLQLSIAFNPMNAVDGGFGLGWGINLTEYNPRTSMLSLRTGETFQVTGSGDTPDIAEKKLDTFHFHSDGNDRYRVVHLSGLVEVLQVGGGSDKRLAVPVQVLAPDGRGLNLSYVPFNGGQRLSTVSDASGVLLRVDRNEISDEVHLQLFPGQGPEGQPLALFVLQLDSAGRVSRIVLPTEDKACWQLTYKVIREIGCLTDVRTPAGAHETMEYGDSGHPFPAEAHPALPRVTRHVVDPGADQPPVDVHYGYSPENFLGHRALSSWSDDGRDNLYRVADPSFRYDSTATLWAEGKAQRTVQRFYNRFHLLTDEITIQGNCRKWVTTTYYADLPENLNKAFDDQPPQCQLPWSEETFWDLTDDHNARRTQKSETRFDAYGNVIERINADGTREVNEYYDVGGEGGLCPPDPENFVRSLRSRTTFPATSAFGNAPTLRTDLEYIALQPLPGDYSKPFVVEHRQTLGEVGGTELKRVQTEYYDDPDAPLLLGRPRSISETLSELATFNDYVYHAGRNARLDEETLAITETQTGFDGTKQVVTQHLSLRTGQPILTQDLNGVEVGFTYDTLGRVLCETIAPGTDYQASRSYTYHLVGGDNKGPARQELTDVRGVKTRTRFDGLSRPVYEEQQDTDAARANGLAREGAVFRQTYQAWHDALGQRVQERVVDWLGQDDLALDTRYYYDAWGERLRVTQPDGVSEVTEMSPFGPHGPVERRWLESADTPARISDRRVSHYNRFGKTCRIEHIDDNATAVFVLEQDYDGLGQCVTSRELFDGLEFPTVYTYDAFRRVVSTQLPDQTLLQHEFAPHSEEALPVGIRVKPANAALPEVVAGLQAFDGLDRLAHRIVGGRRETYVYEGGSPQPFRRTTPAGRQIQFDYVRSLGDAPRTVTAPDDAATYQYAPLSGEMTGAANSQGRRTYVYADTGGVTTERWTTRAGDEHASDYVVSRLGRQLRRTDSGKGAARYSATTTCHYDRHGRLQATEQGVLRTEIVHDNLGRPATTTTHNLLTRQTLVNELVFDTFGRETLRTLRVGGRKFTVTQHWRADDELSRRELHVDGRLLLDEAFHYDRRGRLQRHVCEGEQCPQDRHGNTITQQVFTYDAMDNITRCITNLEGQEPDVADYEYADADPCQLILITHQNNPDTEHFTYDDDGNLLNDHQGRELRYDSLGRLLAMAASHEQTAYHYDGHGELIEMVDAESSSTLRFYQGFQLNHTVRDGKSVHVLYADEEPLGEQSSHGGSARLLLATSIGSIIGEARQDAVLTAAYTAYGESGNELTALLGFHGECREPGGWYLLGRGYRAYCPALMRFNRPDFDSPFGRGGLNPYVYCQGNPVAFRDRSGHRRELPEYKYPPPPVEEPSSGGGWLKWLGVAVSGIFLAVSVVAAPWSLGMSAPLMVASMKGIAMQAAAIGMQVVGTLSTDPTVQMIMMVGSMGLGIYGGIVSAKANAAGKLLIKQQKAGVAPVFNAGMGASDDVFKMPRPHLNTPSGTQSMRGVARHGDTAAGAMPAALATPRAGKLPPPQSHLPRVRLPARRYPLAVKKRADMFTGKPLENSFLWIQRGVRGSPYVAGMRTYR